MKPNSLYATTVVVTDADCPERAQVKKLEREKFVVEGKISLLPRRWLTSYVQWHCHFKCLESFGRGDFLRQNEREFQTNL